MCDPKTEPRAKYRHTLQRVHSVKLYQQVFMPGTTRDREGVVASLAPMVYVARTSAAAKNSDFGNEPFQALMVAIF